MSGNLGQTVRMAIPILPKPERLMDSALQSANFVRWQLFEGLLSVQADGSLASSCFDLSASGPVGTGFREFVFKCLPGLRFAEDVPLFPESLVKALRSAHERNPLTLGEAEISLKGDIIWVSLPQPHANYMHFLAYRPAHTLHESLRDAWGLPLGFGTFEVESWHEAEIVLRRKSFVSGSGVERVVFVDARSCRPDEVDVLINVDARAHCGLEIQSGFSRIPAESYEVSFVFLPIPDEALRRQLARSLLCRREKIWEFSHGPLGRERHPASGLIPPCLPGGQETCEIPAPDVNIKDGKVTVIVPTVPEDAERRARSLEFEDFLLHDALAAVEVDLVRSDNAIVELLDLPDRRNRITALALTYNGFPGCEHDWIVSLKFIEAFSGQVFDLPDEISSLRGLIHEIARERSLGRRDELLVRALKLVHESGYLVPYAWRKLDILVRDGLESLSVNRFRPAQDLSRTMTTAALKELEAWASSLESSSSCDAFDLGEVRDFRSLRNAVRSVVAIKEKALEDLQNERLAHERAKWIAERNAAVANTVQMVAHDVRRPFSQLQMTLEMLKKAKTGEELDGILTLATGAVEKSIRSVNGLLDDIMEIGRDSRIVPEPTSLVTLIEDCLQETLQIRPDAQLRFLHQLEAPELVLVEKQKVARVFSNIVSNAVQAMGGRGTVFFAARSVDGGAWMEVTIGNDGPGVPSDDLARIFETFFTAGKKGGTGLGLAIAKKVVLAHEGWIRCDSPGTIMPVEFRFTLPAQRSQDSRTQGELPRSSEEVLERWKHACAESTVRSLAILGRDAESLGRVRELHQTVGLRIAIVDDDTLYRQALENLILRDEVLRTLAKVRVFSHGDELLHTVESLEFDYVICDVDLGAGSPDGYRITRELRQRGFRNRICIHSNRTLAEDFLTAVEAGADMVLPKPMSRVHLLQFLSLSPSRSRKRRHVRLPRMLRAFLR